MTYSKDTIIGDVTTYEVYEGTPQEIIDLMNRMPQEIDKGQWLTIESISSPTNIRINCKGNDNLDIGEIASKLNEVMQKKGRG